MNSFFLIFTIDFRCIQLILGKHVESKTLNFILFQ